MKFMRRPDLDPQTRIQIVIQAWLNQGVYGQMTHIAKYYQISRTFLYPYSATSKGTLKLPSVQRRYAIADTSPSSCHQREFDAPG